MGVFLQNDTDLGTGSDCVFECCDRLRAAHADRCQDMREEHQITHRDQCHHIWRKLGNV